MSKPKIYRCSDGVDRVASGEVRPPREGEWFIEDEKPVESLIDWTNLIYPILVPVRKVPVRKAKPVAPKPDEFTRKAVELATIEKHCHELHSNCGTCPCPGGLPKCVRYRIALARRVLRLARKVGAK